MRATAVESPISVIDRVVASIIYRYSNDGMTTSIIAIANQKGGVGKTTTTINLGASLAVADKRVLVVDADPQGNSTSGLGLRGKFRKSLYNSVIMGDPLEAMVLDTEVPNLKIVPADKVLAAAEVELVDLPRREFKLKELL